MQKTVSNKSKLLLTSSIVLAVFFSTLILLDHLNIETIMIGVIRELLLIPFFLGIIILPVILLISMAKNRHQNKKQLIYATIITFATLLLIIFKTFFSN